MEIHILWYAGPDGSELISAWYTKEAAESHRERLKNGKGDWDTSFMFVEPMIVKGKKADGPVGSPKSGG